MCTSSVHMRRYTRCFSKFIGIKYKIMPNKYKRKKFTPMYKNILTLDYREHEEIFRSLCEMFPSVDTSVVKLIVDESENNVEQAIETLISLSNNDRTPIKENAEKPIEQLQNNERNRFSNISKMFQKAIFTESDNLDSCYALATCSTNLNHSDCGSHIENLKGEAPQFIVPSVPMRGSASPHKSYNLDSNKAFWNASDSRPFSTHASKDWNTAGSCISKAVEKIRKSDRVLVILRGLPGSGKSSLALQLKFAGVIFSTDDYFMKKGRYLFDCTMLSEAHAWNKDRTEKALQKGITPVVIDNTNVEAWEIKPYILMGQAYNYEVIILEPDTPWKFKVKELASRNKHGVPAVKIAKMKEKYEKNLTVEKILATRRLFSCFNDNLCKGNKNYKVIENEDQIAPNVKNSLIEENCISLEAVVSSGNISLDEKCLSNNFQSSVSQNYSVANQSNTPCNLDDLRILAKNESEDSHSSVSSSFQEISSWDAITELDNSFRWSTLSEDMKYGTKSGSTDNFSLKDSVEPLSSVDNTCSSNSVENLTSTGDDSSVVLDELEDTYKLDQVDFNSYQNISSNSGSMSKNILSSEGELSFESVIAKDDGLTLSQVNNEKERVWPNSELDNGTEVVDYSLISNQVNTSGDDDLRDSMKHLIICDEIIVNNMNLVAKPEQCRSNNTHLSTLDEDKFVNWSLEESVQWNTLADKTDDSFIEKESKATDILCAPKPQRKILESKFCEIRNKNNVNHKSILNISLDSNWKFPEYIQEDSCRSNADINRKLSFKMTTHSQTETRDFDLVHQIAVENSTLDACNYRIINAKPNCEVYTEDFNSKPSVSNLETANYPEVASFDKSTSTDDLADDVEISQKLSYLQECFPDISKEDLRHHLEICHNNEKWLSNLLLEWGYKYNVPEISLKNSSVEKLNDIEKDFKYKNFISSSQRKKYSQTSLESSSSDSSSDINGSTSSSLSSSSSSDNIIIKSKEVEGKSGKENDKTLRLTLNPSFARQLEEQFGPVANSANLYVDIDLELAEKLHANWNRTVNDSKSIKTGKKCKFKKKIRHTSPRHSEPSSFSEIMDQELALMLHKEEKLSKDEDFETKSKRLELYKMLPGADTVVLDEIFESNNCSLEESLLALGEGMDETVKKEEIVEKKKIKETEDDVNLRKKLQIFQEFETGNWHDWVYKEDSNSSEKESSVPLVSSEISLEADELRKKAIEQYQMRMACIKKAQTAFYHGMKEAASFYAQQGREHGEKSKSANKKASELIAIAKNSTIQSDCLDLHHLYTKEAITLLDKFLKEKKGEIKRFNRKQPLVVSVITGKGNHSIQGPKISPAVENFLRSKGYKYSCSQPGKLDVRIFPD